MTNHLIVIGLSLLVATSSFGEDRPKRNTATQASPMIHEICTNLSKPIELGVSKSVRVDNKTSFSTIKAALDFAESHQACAVRITVDTGTYPEPLTITRKTTILAKPAAVTSAHVAIGSSVRNASGFALSLEHMHILNAQDVGLEQNGGELNLSDVTVAHTKAQPQVIGTGIGVRLTGDVRASIGALTLYDNASTALFVSGPQTKVKVFNLVIWDNKAHPLAVKKNAQSNGQVFSDSLAAVDVTDGALLLVEDYSIKSCEFAGIAARKNGRIFLRTGSVEGTKMAATVGDVSYGGINVLAAEQGHIELKNFTIRGASFCGLAAWGGYLKAATGEVTGNVIGLCGHQPPSPTYDVQKCVTGPDIRYNKNTNNLDVDYLPVPCPSGDSSCQGAAVCPGVSWE